MRSTAYAHNFALYDAMLTLYMLSADLLCVIDGLHCGPTSAGDAPSLLVLVLLLLLPPLLAPLRALSVCALAWALWKGGSMGV